MDDVYSNFLLAIQKHDVLQTAKDGSYEPLSAFSREQEWGIPSYDFNSLLDPAHPDYQGKRIAELGCETFQSVKAGVMAAAGFDFGLKLDSDAPVRFGLTAHQMPIIDCVFVFRYNGYWIVAAYRPRPSQIPGQTINAVMAPYGLVNGQRWVRVKLTDGLANTVASAAALICNPKIVYEMAAPSLASGQVAKRRRMRKLKQVPKTQIIRLTKIEKIGSPPPKPPQGGSHSSPRPHDRSVNGFSRTYKRTGLTKWYPGPIKVRGGSEAAGAVRYRVVP